MSEQPPRYQVVVFIDGWAVRDTLHNCYRQLPRWHNICTSDRAEARDEAARLNAQEARRAKPI